MNPEKVFNIKILSMYSLCQIVFLLLIITSIFGIIGCDSLNPPSEIEWSENRNDGYNPEATPEILEIEFISKVRDEDPACFMITTKGVVNIRFSSVDRVGEAIQAIYQPVQSEYQINLGIGDHLIAAQGRSFTGSESQIYYDTVTVILGERPGTERLIIPCPSGFEFETVMCWIPAGSFRMGSEEEENHFPNEIPIHEVTIKNGFWMSKYEVTQAQWKAVFGDNPSEFVDDARPVESINWNEVNQFTIRTGFRLPTEAEWEYACRAGTETPYYWGDHNQNQYAVQGGVYGVEEPSRTAKVGSKLPNPWGLYDMCGNVSELCEDTYHENYINAPENGDSWLEDGDNERRVSRGGSWRTYSYDCRSASRGWVVTTGKSNGGGFRLVLDQY